MAVINAKPFYEGLRFRRGGETKDSIKGECKASECTLLCQDLWKRGYYKIFVDPSVHMFYKLKDIFPPQLIKFKKYKNLRKYSKNYTDLSLQILPPWDVDCVPIEGKYQNFVSIYKPKKM